MKRIFSTARISQKFNAVRNERRVDASAAKDRQGVVNMVHHGGWMHALPLALGAVLMTGALAFAQPANNKPASAFGFPSVAAALEAMRAKSGVQVSTQGGWTVIEDRPALTIWSFTPPGHAAHPAAVRRTITQQGTQIFVDMNVLCEAKKPACDQMVAEFEALNSKMRQGVRR